MDAILFLALLAAISLNWPIADRSFNPPLWRRRVIDLVGGLAVGILVAAIAVQFVPSLSGL